MLVNGCKWLYMSLWAVYGYEWLEIAQIRQKWLKMCRTWLGMAGMDGYCMNSAKWLEMAGYGSNWL